MKYILHCILSLTFYCATAQETALKEDAAKLVTLTFDMSEMNQMKYAIGSTVPEDKKETYKSEYDAAIKVYIEECSKYYIANYSHDEIKQLIAFYETPAGKKLAKDQRKLLSASFPPGKEWDTQLYELKKKKKETEKED